MSEEESEPSEAPWPPQAFVSTADFQSVDYNAVIRDLKSVYDHKLEAAFMAAARNNLTKEPDFSAYRLLASACGLHFRLHDKSGPFGPQLVMDGRRSAIPEDWLGEQNEVFSEILPEVEHPGLRARLADIVWTNDRRKGTAAQIAVLTYCECVEGLVEERFEDRFPSDHKVSLEEVDLVERSAQIHSRSSKRGSPLHERIASILRELYQQAREHLDIVPLRRLAELLSRHALISMDELAAHAEAAALAAEKRSDAYPLAIKQLWNLAAFAHQEAGRSDEERRCLIAGVDQTLQMAGQVGSASAQAHWYREAIGELRTIPDTAERREQLRLAMRSLQEKALEEMGSFSIPMDLTEIATGTIAIFEKLTLSDALKEFALLARPTSANQLRKKALEPHGLAEMFGAAHLDHDGKITKEVEGAPLDGEPSEDWLKSKMVQQMRFRYEIAVSGQLEPARRVLAREFPFSERHFRFIALQSPFIPRSHVETFALGFARMMQGDMLSAGPIIIPQLEQCVRHVLMNSSVESSKMRSDLTQEDRSLSALLEMYHDDLIRIFGEDIVFSIDMLFNHRPGPALRHEFAHGKIGDGSCGDPAVYYGCCFIYLLVCVPLLPIWAEHVAPAIEAGSF
ncbi:DUF4209 domain-containing protein [Afifella sp. H1R]|uniref:DUF4209 domain-containing protein n=1 Tax=Afifella sp. H1R TaxID=2908841 RepID=UPI001F47355C|nr:DUF4209 domain-containing protein [Afifella sp. H1R]MCF1504713.1 DUF4209 domain-containing protein [Afifella sp. H1R]